MNRPHRDRPASPGTTPAVTPRLALLGVGALAALALTACSGAAPEAGVTEGGQTASSAPAGQGSETEETAGATSSDDAFSEGGAADGDGPDAGAGPGGVDPADAVETLTYDIPSGEIEGTMTVGLHHLEVDGQTMELMLSFTPEYEGTEAHSLWDLHGNNHSMVAPALYDRENLKQYNILNHQGSGTYVDSNWATAQDLEFASGTTQAFYANYAAPEDEIESINVGLPVGVEFKDVELARAGEGN